MLHSYLISVSFLVQFFILMCPLTFSDQDEVKNKSALDSQTTRCISSVSSFSLGPTSLRSFFPRPIEIFTVCLCLTCWLPAYLSFHCHYLLSSPLITHLSCPCLFVCLSLYLALHACLHISPSFHCLVLLHTPHSFFVCLSLLLRHVIWFSSPLIVRFVLWFLDVSRASAEATILVGVNGLIFKSVIKGSVL